VTTQNINIVLANALKCSAEKAEEISDLLSQGNECANIKIRELKILNDSINLLLCFMPNTDYKECLSEKQAENIINNIMATCDICDCQLNQE